MAELRPAPAPPRTELLHALRGRLGVLVQGWQPLAEDLLGAEARIDLLGADSRGRAVLALVGGTGEDLELIGRGLAQHAWVLPRVRDWVKLAPDLPLQPEAGVLAVLLCPSFRPEALAAARALTPSPLSLATLRFLADGTAIEPLLEPVEAPAHAPRARVPLPPAAQAPFRTGLTEADLALSRDERVEFE